MKYKNLTSKSPKKAYLGNLFLAVADIFWDMVLESDIREKEARRLIIRDVNLIIDESLRQYKATHGRSTLFGKYRRFA